MFTRFSSNIQGIVLALMGFACFSVADTAAKWLTEFYPVFQVIGFNAVVTLGTCLVLAKPLGGMTKTLKTQKLKVHLARSVCNTIISFLIVLSLSQVPLATLYTIIFFSPFLTTLMAIPAFKEKVDLSGWIAIALGFIGVLVVMRPGLEVFNPWLILPLLATFFISILFLLARKLDDNQTILSLGFFPALLNFAIYFPMAYFVYGLPGLEHAGGFLIAGITIIGGLTFTALAFQTAKASTVAPVQYSQILWGVGLGYLIFGDLPDFWTMVGAAIIISSGIYLLETARRIKSSSSP